MSLLLFWTAISHMINKLITEMAENAPELRNRSFTD